MTAWPGSLPQNPRVGLTASPQSTVVRTTVAQGYDRIRQRFRIPTRYYPVMIDTDDTGLATLDAFFHSTINGGASKFDWIDPATGAAASVRMGQYTATMKSSRTGAVLSQWEISFMLEVPPQ